MSAHSADWTAFWAEARDINIMDLWARLGAPSPLKRAGVEFVGPCPACGGSDRFAINPRQGVFNCRGSEGGDAIKLVEHVRGLSNIEAAEFILERDRPGGRREETDEEREAREARARQWREAAQLRLAREAKEAAAKRKRDQEACEAILSRAVKLEGTHGEAYFRERGLTPPRRMLGDVRFVAGVDYWGVPKPYLKNQQLEHLATLPAVVCVIRDIEGRPVAIHMTFLDPDKPSKWVAPWEADVPKKERLNPSKKIRNIAETWSGGMIRLGLIGERLAIAEGVETALSWHAMGYGPEDISIAAAASLDNLVGGVTGSVDHPVKRKPDGSPYRIANGWPAPDKPGVLLPEWVREVIILGDGDSDPWHTQGRIAAQVRRWKAQGRVVSVHMAPPRCDWNNALVLQRRLEAKALAAQIAGGSAA
jgi:hypothetical protein